MKIDFIDLKREWTFFEKKFLSVLKKFGQSGRYVLGSEVEMFEKKFATYCGYTYAVGVSTGLSAIEIALRAYGIKKGDEVITVANSAVATALAISAVGAKAIFCDIGEDFLIDVKKIESLIHKKTKVILPVHLFGKVCNMHEINKIAKKHELVVIEDACQAHGAIFENESAKNTKAFSFYPTKNLGALGEAGALLTNDKRVRDFVLLYRNYGQQGRYRHVMKGSNERIDPIQCVLMTVKLQHLDRFIKQRRKIAKKYIDALQMLDGMKLLTYDTTSAYHLFVVRVFENRRDELRTYLHERGIETMVHYPTAIHQQSCYRAQYSKLILKNTDQYQKEILSLPCYPFLKEDEQRYIVDRIKSYFSK